MFAAAGKKGTLKAKMVMGRKRSSEEQGQGNVGGGDSTGGKTKMALAAKKSTLKAKTLIDAMQTLNLIPSFSASDFGGDLLPENILIKNIIEGKISNFK